MNMSKCKKSGNTGSVVSAVRIRTKVFARKVSNGSLFYACYGLISVKIKGKFQHDEQAYEQRFSCRYLYRRQQPGRYAALAQPASR